MRTLILLTSILGMLANYVLYAYKLQYFNILLFAAICIIVLINIANNEKKELAENERWIMQHKIN